PTLEQKHKGLSICEAGCYQCLLSYFNQPDHDNINRRNEDALSLLVALTDKQVVMKALTQSVPLGQGSAEGDNLSAEFLKRMSAKGLPQPDACNVPVAGGKAIAA